MHLHMIETNGGVPLEMSGRLAKVFEMYVAIVYIVG